MNMEEKVTIEKTGWWKSFLKSEFFYHYKHNIPAIIGSILVVVAILVAVFGRFIAPQNPYDLTAISLQILIFHLYVRRRKSRIPSGK